MRRSSGIAVLLIVAFLVHDAFMAVHGHIVFAGDDPHAAMAHDMDAASIAGGNDRHESHPVCDAIREGVPHEETGVARDDDGASLMFVLPDARTTSLRQANVLRVHDPPPSFPPDVRRALLQVYRE